MAYRLGLAAAAAAGVSIAAYLLKRRQEVLGTKLRLTAATDDSTRVATLKELFARMHGSAPQFVALAGGRVNLIGEHVDYPDVQFATEPKVHLFSMGGAIQNSYLVAAAAREDGKVVMCHAQVSGGTYTVALSELEALEAQAEADRKGSVPMDQRATPVWALHTLGAVMEMLRAGVLCQGVTLLLTSNVPHGAGMSNSAANCVALGLAFNAMYPALGLDSDIKLVTFARSSENSKFAGGHCGWLDQLLIVCSKASMLTKIDYADNSVEHFESRLPPHMQFVALNSNVPHVLAESDYPHRVAELRLGIEFLSAQLGRNAGGPNLTLGTLNALLAAVDAATAGNTPIDLSQLCGGALTRFESLTGEMAEPLGPTEVQRIKEAVEASFAPPVDLPMHTGKGALASFGIILRRMRHQKMSALLVPLAGEAVANGDAALFGTLLDLEGQSLRMSGDFMITGDNGAQDALLDCALAAGKALRLRVHGRMLGGGGGGNVLLMVDATDASRRWQWEEDVKAAYGAWAERQFPGKGIQATVIVPAISAGARLV